MYFPRRTEVVGLQQREVWTSSTSQKWVLPRRSRVAKDSGGVADLWQLEASHADERQSAAYSTMY